MIFAQLTKRRMTLWECSICGAATSDFRLHGKWHKLKEEEGKPAPSRGKQERYRETALGQANSDREELLMAVDRNTQINFQGDPAKEAAFIQGQEERTSEAAHAALPQLTSTDNGDLTEAIRGADILDPDVQPAGYEAPDAPPGAEQGANVNAEFENDVRTGADASGETGDGGEGGGQTLTSGRFEGDDPGAGPQKTTLGGEGGGTGGTVEQASPEGGDAKRKGGRGK